MRRLLASVCVLGTMLIAAPAAEAAFLKGISGPIKFAPGAAGCAGPERCSAFPLYTDLQPQVFQYQIQWNQIAPVRPANPRDPNDPAYAWPNEFQFAVDEAGAAGIKVMFLITGSPPWANGGRSSSHAPDPGAYADFAFAAARKYPSVHHWEVWGEPTRAGNFLPRRKRGARKYARILDAAYAALKSEDPGNVVIGGMTFSGGSPRPPIWIKALRLPNGKPPRMDWYGHNPFERRFPRIKDRPIGLYRGLNDIDTLWREVKRHYRGRRKGRPRKLWLSEWTVQSDHASFVFSFFVSRAAQARRLTAGFALARRQRYVAGMSWYQLIDYPPAPRNPTWGLITYGGQKKPAFGAYRALP
jgi:hypothetical protein